MSFNFEQIKNVLVLMPDKHMGDLVLSLSSINALKELFKEKKIFIVVDSAYREIIEAVDGLNNVLFYPRKLLNKENFIKQLALQFDFLRQLRSTSPDIAIDLHGGVASSIMTFLSGASLRVGRTSAKRAFLYNMKVDPLNGKHKIHSYFGIASAVGCQSKAVIYRLAATESKRTALKNILLKEGIAVEKPIICIHPVAGRIFKEWIPEGFAEIADSLASEGFQVVFIGSSGDAEKIHEIISITKRKTYNFAGKISLGELIALFEISSLYIGNDSGPMHLASAVGTLPIIGLFFRPGSDKSWHPFSEKSIILKGDTDCQKCKRNDCQYDFKCTKTISPDNVKAAVQRLINSSPQRSQRTQR